MKNKRVIVLVVLLILAIVIGFFVYKKLTSNNIKYVEVKFIDDYNHETLSTQTLEVGKDAEVPNEPKHEGCKFSGWYDSSNKKIESFKNIQNDLIAYAKCSDIYYKVKFIDSISKRVIDTQKVKYGNDAVAPVAPKHYGYNFVRWRGNYYNVTSNLVVSAIYGSQSAKYVVKYYTVDGDNTTLYATKTFNSYVNRKVTASIISISGYQYNRNYSLNKLSGKVSADNSLVLKVYYDSKTYKVIINGEETTYNYDDEIKLPSLSKTVKLTYEENEAVNDKLGENNVDLTLVGYCKNSKTCDSPLAVGTVINVKESAEYYPVWKMDMELNLPAGNGYELDGETYSFVKWIGPDNVYYFEGDKIRFTDDLSIVAIYKKDSESTETKVAYTVNTYRDEELYSSITEYGNIGDEILGSLYAKTVGGYELESYTNSIFLTEDPNNNLIEVYYVTGKNDDAPIISRSIRPSTTLEEQNLELDLPDEGEKKETLELEPKDDGEDKKEILDSEQQIDGEKKEVLEPEPQTGDEGEKKEVLEPEPQAEDEGVKKEALEPEPQAEDEGVKKETLEPEPQAEDEGEKKETLESEPQAEDEGEKKEEFKPEPQAEDEGEKKEVLKPEPKLEEDKDKKVEANDNPSSDESKVKGEAPTSDKKLEDAPPKVDTTPQKDTAASKVVESVSDNTIEEN